MNRPIKFRVWDVQQNKFLPSYGDMIEQFNNVMCERCGENDACEPHTCPYSEDIHNDKETLCTCCEKCAHECCMDI